MNTEQVVSTTDNSIGIPLDTKTFARVVLDFLGHKEVLSYKTDDNFLIHLEDLSQFNHLLKSKISYQKNIFLDHFSINFGYTDGTFRKINGEKALDTFLETRAVGINSVNLNWKIIIKFDESPTIETQEINLLFVKNFHHNIQDKNLKNKDEYSFIDLNINHTNQSWALDILNAFKEKISEVKTDQHKLSRIYKKLGDSPFTVLTFLIGFYISTLYVFIPTESSFDKELRKDLIQLTLQEDHKTEFSKVISLLDVSTHDFNDIKNFKNKNSEVEKLIDSHNLKTYITFILLAIILVFPFILVRFIRYSINYLDHKSFIVINKTSQNQLDSYNRNKSKLTYIGTTLIISTILISIISAAIFKLIERIIF